MGCAFLCCRILPSLNLSASHSIEIHTTHSKRCKKGELKLLLMFAFNRIYSNAHSVWARKRVNERGKMLQNFTIRHKGNFVKFILFFCSKSTHTVSFMWWEGWANVVMSFHFMNFREFSKGIFFNEKIPNWARESSSILTSSYNNAAKSNHHSNFFYEFLMILNDNEFRSRDKFYEASFRVRAFFSLFAFP